MKVLEPGDVIQSGKNNYVIEGIFIESPLNQRSKMTIRTIGTLNEDGLNILNFTDEFLMLKKMLIQKKLLTEEEIWDLVNAGFVMDKLTE